MSEALEMERIYWPAAAVHAYLQLLHLNLNLWKPQVAEWLHSEEADSSLKLLLLTVPCSPTIH